PIRRGDRLAERIAMEIEELVEVVVRGCSLDETVWRACLRIHVHHLTPRHPALGICCPISRIRRPRLSDGSTSSSHVDRCLSFARNASGSARTKPFGGSPRRGAQPGRGFLDPEVAGADGGATQDAANAGGASIPASCTRSGAAAVGEPPQGSADGEHVSPRET